jgi:ribonuclease P protein component
LPLFSLAQKNSRIRQKSHFNSIFADNRKSFGKYVIIYYKEKRDSEKKIAFITSKKVGNAVIRNKCRRWMKEIYRQEQPGIDINFDIIMIAKRGLNQSDYETVKTDITRTLKNKDLLRDN